MGVIAKVKKGVGIEEGELREVLGSSVRHYASKLARVLLLPPDYTRLHSGAGKITAIYYELLKSTCKVDIMPALGTHEPMTDEEIREMFGAGIPRECFLVHNWRSEVVKIGEVPGDFVSTVSDGLIDTPISVEVNRRIIHGNYDLIISIGQVVPHEVVGMAGYNKNIFVGCGGSHMINSSHMLGAFYGMERIMGRDRTPVRRVFDYAEEKFLKGVPLLYVLTVTTVEEGNVIIHGIFIGKGRETFEEAVKLSRQKNLTFVEKPFKKAVVYLDDKEYKSTWLGNKAIYRTRMAVADGGELVVLAPGVRKFGEDPVNDRLIRKYGYAGRERVLELCRENADLQDNLSVAAHLIHGSSDGRFSVTYAVEKLSRNEIESVNYRYMPLEEAYARYNPSNLKDGFNITEEGEEIFFISNPALGLWAERRKFQV